MKSPQYRLNARTVRQDAKRDALSLALFLSKGLAAFLLALAVFAIFDAVVDLSEMTAAQISAASSDW